MITTAKRDALARDIAKALNYHGIDSDLNTPDFELAAILVAVVGALPVRPSPMIDRDRLQAAVASLEGAPEIEEGLPHRRVRVRPGDPPCGATHTEPETCQTFVCDLAAGHPGNHGETKSQTFWTARP